MTTKFVVSELLASRILKRTKQEFFIEGAAFDIMALDKDMIEMVKECGTHEEMLFFAADHGIVYNGTRFVDHPDFVEDDLISLWDEDLKDIESDPCIRHCVGDKVCEISGLSSALEDKLKSEMIQVGDHEFHESTDINNLDQDSLEQDATLYANA